VIADVEVLHQDIAPSLSLADFYALLGTEAVKAGLGKARNREYGYKQNLPKMSHVRECCPGHFL